MAATLLVVSLITGQMLAFDGMTPASCSAYRDALLRRTEQQQAAAMTTEGLRANEALIVAAEAFALAQMARVAQDKLLVECVVR